MVFSKATSSNGAHRRGDGPGRLARALQAKKGGSEGTWQRGSRSGPAGPHTQERHARHPCAFAPSPACAPTSPDAGGVSCSVQRTWDERLGGKRLGANDWGPTTGGQRLGAKEVLIKILNERRLPGRGATPALWARLRPTAPRLSKACRCRSSRARSRSTTFAASSK